ncbi:unnamed protein product [Rotaria sp. Silwood2]|nr:unnamed protein product [Rotaria sp. Silwood2]CAF4377199.1 unnamed protein product [Rotaria sp. Silwood2]CAF4425398.1 unnamed protein product [Rotaria sp. Silwood2]
MTCFLSNIINLGINVDTLDDCLCLLDGRLAHLHTLTVKIYNIQASMLDIDSTALTNLKYFSLTSCRYTKTYDSHVVPLLRRMIDLEQLMICLTVNQRSTFIDDIHLENEILIHMPRLRAFIFNIITYTLIINGVNQQSNDEF